MAKNIRFRGKFSRDISDVNLILPDFVLCLRDFSLRLVNENNQPISEDEYLEACLESNTKKGNKYNEPREFIKKYFQNRRCFSLVPPGDFEVVQKLNTLRFKDLSRKFQDDAQRFVSHIYSCKPKNILASKPINGEMFATLASRFVVAIEEPGAVPDVDEAFIIMAKTENERIKKEVLKMFMTQMDGVSLPVASKVLHRVFTNAQQEALKYLREHVVFDENGDYELRTKLEMDIFWTERKDKNAEDILKKCEKTLEQAFHAPLENEMAHGFKTTPDLKVNHTSLAEKIKQKAYEVRGGHRMYKQDIGKMKEKFKKALRDFEEHEISSTLFKFTERMEVEEVKIITADCDLETKAKEETQKLAEENIRNMFKENEEKIKNALEQQNKEFQDHEVKLYNQRLEQMAKENEDFKRLIEEKIKKVEESEKYIAHLKQKEKERKKRNIFARLSDAVLNK